MRFKPYDFIKTFLKKRQGFAKFLVVGSANTVLDICLYLFFANLLHINPLVSNFLSTGITLCVSFFLNYHFVFQSKAHRLHSALQFIFVTLFNAWVIQTIVISIIVHMGGSMILLREHKDLLNLVAKLCSVFVSFILNFIGYRYIFRQVKKSPIE